VIWWAFYVRLSYYLKEGRRNERRRYKREEQKKERRKGKERKKRRRKEKVEKGKIEKRKKKRKRKKKKTQLRCVLCKGLFSGWFVNWRSNKVKIFEIFKFRQFLIILICNI
jgi:hypothetical protein